MIEPKKTTRRPPEKLTAEEKEKVEREAALRFGETEGWEYTPPPKVKKDIFTPKE